MSAPALSPDGRTLYYTSTEGGTYTLWSMSVPGGTPRSLGHTGMRIQFATSPDGRLGAFIDNKGVSMLCDLPDCTNARPAGIGVFGRFTPDGRGFSYVPPADPKNVWIQPFNGTAYPVTKFTDRYVVLSHSFSHDGRRLLVHRGIATSDIVLISGVR
jgi:hypothetical protein